MQRSKESLLLRLFLVVCPFRRRLLLHIPSLHQFHLDRCCCQSGSRRPSMPLLPITPSSDEAPPPPRRVAANINPSRSKKPGPRLSPIPQFPPSIRPSLHLLPPLLTQSPRPGPCRRPFRDGSLHQLPHWTPRLSRVPLP